MRMNILRQGQAHLQLFTLPQQLLKQCIKRLHGWDSVLEIFLDAFPVQLVTLLVGCQTA